LPRGCAQKYLVLLFGVFWDHHGATLKLSDINGAIPIAENLLLKQQLKLSRHQLFRFHNAKTRG
jgi:hypothetical protein